MFHLVYRDFVLGASVGFPFDILGSDKIVQLTHICLTEFPFLGESISNFRGVWCTLSFLFYFLIEFHASRQ